VKQRRLQGGSLVGYVLVAGLLGLVLIGGLYGLQRYNLSDRPQVADGQAEEREQEKTAGGDEAPSSKEGATRDDDAWSDRPAGEEAAPTDDEATGAGESATAADELPATGPNDGPLMALAVAVLTYVAVSYVRAHRWTSRGE